MNGYWIQSTHPARSSRKSCSLVCRTKNDIIRGSSVPRGVVLKIYIYIPAYAESYFCLLSFSFTISVGKIQLKFRENYTPCFCKAFEHNLMRFYLYAEERGTIKLQANGSKVNEVTCKRKGENKGNKESRRAVKEVKSVYLRCIASTME